MSQPMRILYVTPDISWPLSFGGDIRKWNLLQGLQQAGAVDALVFLRDGRQITPEAFAGCAHVVPMADAGMLPDEARRYQSTIGRGVLTLTRRWPYQYLGVDLPRLTRHLPQVVPLDAYDLVWFAGARRAVHVSPLVNCPTVLDGDDFEYVREWLLLRGEAWYGAKLWNYLNVAKLWAMERRFNRRFSAVVRCSAEDARRHAGLNVHVIANGTRIPARVERAPVGRLLFVGDLGYQPNRQGLEWFLSTIWPAVRLRVPEAGLDLVGRNESWIRSRAHGRDGIVVHGFAPELEPFYRAAAATIAPLQAGGGTRLKILESLAYAVPVVSTRLGAFGLDLPAGLGLSIANAPDAFAAACARFLAGKHEGVAAAEQGRAFMATHYDWSVIRDRVARMAESVGRQGRTPSD